MRFARAGALFWVAQCTIFVNCFLKSANFWFVKHSHSFLLILFFLRITHLSSCSHLKVWKLIELIKKSDNEERAIIRAYNNLECVPVKSIRRVTFWLYTRVIYVSNTRCQTIRRWLRKRMFRLPQGRAVGSWSFSTVTGLSWSLHPHYVCNSFPSDIQLPDVDDLANPTKFIDESITRAITAKEWKAAEACHIQADSLQ